MGLFSRSSSKAGSHQAASSAASSAAAPQSQCAAAAANQEDFEREALQHVGRSSSKASGSSKKFGLLGSRSAGSRGSSRKNSLEKSPGGGGAGESSHENAESTFGTSSKKSKNKLLNSAEKRALKQKRRLKMTREGEHGTTEPTRAPGAGDPAEEPITEVEEYTLSQSESE